ncbi:prefoldin subunit 5 [Osmia bicornis bicornis]|uniref:prefoldin subunit 5 n=1 Tax=Osmia bicornis bicornis TaxID=1437191 RepID=UPI0010F5817C|nr:prefoldin subunit 5 [Osmia bicornis bicornis]XP_029054130.1 prefoldin subunit 5 [Osmia bicornis bicornis]XP_029054215.1 prefoldin subunit 5 [Osmia bicornis bicornis]
MSEVSMSEAPHLQQIDLTTLNLQQLTSLKQQLDLDLGIFQDSLQTLKIAQTKFQESGSCLEKVTPAMEGNEVLVPLTGSMYVVGKLADTSNVLFDIGTGYYIQKNVSDAKEYFERRVGYITTQLENIQQLGLEKSKVRDAVVDVIEMKLQNQMQKEGSEHT